ncbi:serine hydrolase domain-containing protein [Allosphingosinicella sp.]|jgi:CubicO group peptidase (beta-lactamase class C family)|uniref:serine hydrolase domain-containing protein n=1 Tax=Allosphingosinicella sp. TaxID=2823234 RepID=UPI002F005C76
MRKLLAALLLAAAAPAVAQPGLAAPPSLQQTIAAIEGYFRRYQREAHVPGLVYGIVRGGRLVHFGAIGVQDLDSGRPAGAETLFRIASMSKAFTALAILKLRDEGRLSLDALAEAYVPEMRRWRYPTGDSPRIRIRDLLSHTGGFVTDDPWGDRQQPLSEADFTAMIRSGVPFTRAPQTQFEYSNFGYALLGRIVTNVSGIRYDRYIEREIMRPLGMASTGYDVLASSQVRRALGYRWENEAFVREPDMANGAFGAMGGVQTSANDYARWVAFLLSAWPARDGQDEGPVRRSSVRELAQGLNFPQLARRPGDTGEAACRQAAVYGMGLRVAVDCDLGLTLAHGGGYPGYGSFMLLLPDHGTGIFAFVNRTYGGPTGPVWDAAMALHRASLLNGRAIPVSDALAETYRAAARVYSAGSVEAARGRLAVNFLMDRSAENWARELARLKTAAGECRTDSPIVATGALAGRFSWTCERATLQGNLLLAPTDPPTIQALRFNVVAAP